MVGSESYLNNGIFSVKIGDMELNFSRVSGLKTSFEYDTYAEGGQGVVLLPKPPSAASTVSFEKGVITEAWAGAKCFRTGIRICGIIINVLKNGAETERFQIDDAVVTAWELGELNGLANGVLVNKFTLAHTGIMIW